VVQDCDALFPLLLTSTSLQELHVTFRNRCDDDVMSALGHFLVGSSLVTFDIHLCDMILSQAAFTSLCDGVARSSLHKLRLVGANAFRVFNLEIANESLARAIVESSLEEATISISCLCSALKPMALCPKLGLVHSVRFGMIHVA
jgi:hypothetical protein